MIDGHIPIFNYTEGEEGIPDDQAAASFVGRSSFAWMRYAGAKAQQWMIGEIVLDQR